MNDIVINNDFDISKCENIGIKLIKTNEFYKSFINIMENKDLRNFFLKYMTDLTDIRTIIMFIKLYEIIEKESDNKLNTYQKLAIVDSIIKNKDLRSKFISLFISENKKITNIYNNK